MSFAVKFLKILSAGVLSGAFVCGSALAQSYSYEPLSEPGASYAVGYGVNQTGQIVGAVVPGQTDALDTFIENKGEFQTIVYPVSYGTAQPDGINRSETVVGWWQNLSTSPATFMSFVSTVKGKKPRNFTSFVYPGATATFAGGINDSSEVVGSYVDAADVTHGFTYKITGGQFTSFDFPSATATVPSAISDSSQIVGYYEDNSGGVHGFRSSKGAMSTIDFPTAVGSTEVAAINTKGTVVGIYGQIRDGAPQGHGFVLSGGTYSTIDYPGADGTYLVGIDSSGNLLGYYYGTSCTPPRQEQDGHPCGFIAEIVKK